MSMPSIIFESNGALFSILSNNVQSIIHLPHVTSLPNSPTNVRGIIKHRDVIYTVVDFRILTSQTSIVDDLSNFRNMLEQRERDHINWLIELEKSVTENRPFTLATDPHKCAFGKWYDHYSTENIGIKKILYKFAEPHKKIHNIAIEIENLKLKGNIEQVRVIIDRTRNEELNTMKSLFKELKNDAELEFKESAILLNLNTRMVALAVDRINSVEDIERKEIQNLNNSSLLNFDENFISGLGESKEKELVIMVSDEMIV